MVGMSLSSDQNEPVIERTPGGGETDECTSRALRQRIRQQELLAELGVLALQGTSLIGMLDHTVRMTAEGLGAEYCKVLEYIPTENQPSGSCGRWAGMTAWSGIGQCRGGFGVACRLCLADRQARYF